MPPTRSFGTDEARQIGEQIGYYTRLEQLEEQAKRDHGVT